MRMKTSLKITLILLIMIVGIISKNVFGQEKKDAEEIDLTESNINTYMELDSEIKIDDLERIQGVFEHSGAIDNTVVYPYDVRKTYKIRTRVGMHS